MTKAIKAVAGILVAYMVLSIIFSIAHANGCEWALSKRHGLTVVQLTEGVGEDVREDGRRNGTDSNGFYIAYDAIQVNEGDTVYTLFVYNPLTTYEDDIIYRNDLYVSK